MHRFKALECHRYLLHSSCKKKELKEKKKKRKTKASDRNRPRNYLKRSFAQVFQSTNISEIPKYIRLH